MRPRRFHLPAAQYHYKYIDPTVEDGRGVNVERRPNYYKRGHNGMKFEYIDQGTSSPLPRL